MSLRLLLVLAQWTLLLSPLHAQLTIQIGQLPANTPDNSTIYAAGSFNNWAPDNPDYTFAPDATGVLSLVLTDLAPGEYTFKLTRGSWPTVEGNENGGYRPDRVFRYTGSPTTLTVDVLSWEDQGGSRSTAATNVQILSHNFSMLQLGRERRIWLYLPPDYATSNRRYPVLYMHDGQNLFDAATSFSGEWQVDETLNA
ncbi:MAG: alpha/beta hydrolase, partial [Bacteroidetes bacterium]